MNIQKTIQSLTDKGYEVSYFENDQDAVEYLKNEIHGATIGFGGSQTLTDLHLLEILSESNEVFAPDFPKEGEKKQSGGSEI